MSTERKIRKGKRKGKEQIVTKRQREDEKGSGFFFLKNFVEGAGFLCMVLLI